MNALITPMAQLLEINAQIRKWFDDIEDNGKNIAVALKRVHEEKMYLLTHTTFTAYFEDVFKKDRNRGYQLINWAKMPTLVNNERQARELIGYPPEIQAKVIEEVGGVENATAASLRAALHKQDAAAVRHAEETAATHREQAPPSRDLMERMQICADQLKKLIKRFFSKEAVAETFPMIDEVMARLDAD